MAVGRFDDRFSPRQWLTMRERARQHTTGGMLIVILLILCDPHAEFSFLLSAP